MAEEENKEKMPVSTEDYGVDHIDLEKHLEAYHKWTSTKYTGHLRDEIFVPAHKDAYQHVKAHVHNEKKLEKEDDLKEMEEVQDIAIQYAMKYFEKTKPTHYKHYKKDFEEIEKETDNKEKENKRNMLYERITTEFDQMVGQDPRSQNYRGIRFLELKFRNEGKLKVDEALHHLVINESAYIEGGLNVQKAKVTNYYFGERADLPKAQLIEHLSKLVEKVGFEIKEPAKLHGLEPKQLEDWYQRFAVKKGEDIPPKDLDALLKQLGMAKKKKEE